MAAAAPSSELAQRLYDKNIELENRRRRSAQARVPSDPNAWQQMRENYEAIILEDHAFTEQHNIEYALWQLHYRRIEEFRAHFSAALASKGSSTSQVVKAPPRPDRISKIRVQFKTFLSEATGFYHDLILKIRAKYGLPLGHFPEDSGNQITMEKDGKKSTEMKKGLISCHRCLIYLGDLARYKGLYGEGDSKSRDYTAASSYYMQAVSLWPSSGNPHHQLGILATYSGDELMAVYRYFRSLAVESPFPTARDNLIVAFEKNRQSFSQLHGDTKASAIGESPVQKNVKGSGKAEAKLQSKDANIGNSLAAETTVISDLYKVFCTRFVRLNGILFTRTSLETFPEVLSLVSHSLNELLSCGPEEELNFGKDAVESGLTIVRLISVLVFTIYNVNRGGEGQTYADIVQHKLVLQNAITAAFELVGHMMKKCAQLRDPCSSYLFPGILVFIEWLACSPDVATLSEIDNKQTTVRSLFWNHCTSLLNKLLASRLVVMDIEDDTCFFNMASYEEGETENRFALWEDFELRGFLPLQPAQSILDFLGKRYMGGDGNKEKTARVKRILAAGKALSNVDKVDQKLMLFDAKLKKFIFGVEPPKADVLTRTPFLGGPNSYDLSKLPTETAKDANFVQPKSQFHEEEDEEIVFKPTATENRSDLSVPKDFVSVTAHHDDLPQQNAFDAVLLPPVLVANGFLQHPQPIQSHSSMWLGQQASLANGLRNLHISENGHGMKPGLQEDTPISHHYSLSLPVQQSVNANASVISYSQAERGTQSKIDLFAPSAVTSGSFAVNTSSAFAASSRKSPVKRPVRHVGPPPGFNSVPPKSENEPVSGSDLVPQKNISADNYGWLDGYKLPVPMEGLGLNLSTNYSVGTSSFPFPGKQVPPMQFPEENQKGWENIHSLEQLNLQQEQLRLQQLMNGSQQFIPPTEQYHGQSLWGGHYPV